MSTVGRYEALGLGMCDIILKLCDIVHQYIIIYFVELISSLQKKSALIFYQRIGQIFTQRIVWSSPNSPLISPHTTTCLPCPTQFSIYHHSIRCIPPLILHISPTPLEAIDTLRRTRKISYIHLTSIRAYVRSAAARSAKPLVNGWERRLHRRLKIMADEGKLEIAAGGLRFAIAEPLKKVLDRELRRESGGVAYERAIVQVMTPGRSLWVGQFWILKDKIYKRKNLYRTLFRLLW